MHPTNPALPGPAAALLRGIGTCAVSELVPQVAAAILDDTDGTTTGPALLALRDGDWITERQHDVYLVAEAVRDQDRALAEHADSAQDRHDVVVRVASLLTRPLRDANTAAGRDLADAPPVDGATPWREAFVLGPSEMQALAWADAHRDLVVEVAQAALEVSEPAWAEWLCGALWVVGQCCGNRGLSERTAEVRARAAEQSGDPRAARRVVGRAGLAAIEREDWDAADGLLQRYTALTAAATDPHAERDRRNAAKRRGLLYLRRGLALGEPRDLVDAVAVFTDVIERYAYAGQFGREGVARMFRAQAHAALGDRITALADTRTAVDLLHQQHDRLHEMRALTQHAELLLDSNPSHARFEVAQAETIADALGASPADRIAIYLVLESVCGALIRNLSSDLEQTP